MATKQKSSSMVKVEITFDLEKYKDVFKDLDRRRKQYSADPDKIIEYEKSIAMHQYSDCSWHNTLIFKIIDSLIGKNLLKSYKRTTWDELSNALTRLNWLEDLRARTVAQAVYDRKSYQEVARLAYENPSLIDALNTKLQPYNFKIDKNPEEPRAYSDAYLAVYYEDKCRPLNIAEVRIQKIVLKELTSLLKEIE